MRNLFLAALTVATLASPAAFADALTIGSANTAPVFANPSGNSAMVADIGSANTAPTFSPVARDGQVVVEIGSANRAPVFAQARRANANVALVK